MFSSFFKLFEIFGRPCGAATEHGTPRILLIHLGLRHLGALAPHPVEIKEMSKEEIYLI